MSFLLILYYGVYQLPMDGEKAEDIAKRFLSQNYDVIRIEKTSLAGKEWIIQVMVSSFGKISSKKVIINNKTGDIDGWS